MLFFHIRPEGCEIKSGFNFYPLSDKYNKGFVFSWFTKGRSIQHVYRVRYSTHCKSLFTGYSKFYLHEIAQKYIEVFGKSR